MGMIEVSGLAVGPYTIIAPITSKPCHYYRTLIWEWKQQGKNRQWVKVAAECVHVPFFLDDNTGRVLVDPRGAELDIHRDFQQEFCDSLFTTKEPAPENVRSFLARHGIVTSNKIKVEEFCIKPKNSLFILGTLAENPGLEVTSEPIRERLDMISTEITNGLRRSLIFSTQEFGSESDDSVLPQLTGTKLLLQEVVKPHVIQLSSDSGPTNSLDMTQQQRIAAALRKAGISNPAAWCAAGLEEAAAPAMIEDAEVIEPQEEGKSSSDHSSGTNGFDSRPAVVLMQGTNNKAFMISWRSQREVARSLAWKCGLMIWGGPALALVSLYVLLNMRGLW